MCGRYNLITNAQALVDFFKVRNHLEFRSRYNIAPSQDAPVVRSDGAQRELALLRWGLIPHWAKDMKIGYHTINARAESVARKPAFRDAFRHRRCLVPATGFYEWKATASGKQPYNIRIGEGRLFAFAGLWEQWRRAAGAAVESFTIIVTEANKTVLPLHDRMPVILHPRDYEAWLDPTLQDPALLQPLLQPCPASWLNYYPVSRRLNSPACEDAECAAPIDNELG